MSGKSSINKDDLQVVLATDCGSTTTKAVLFEKTSSGWRQTFRGEAPTTVEKPVADVTIGAINAFTELEELSGRKILNDQAGTAKDPFIKRVSSGKDGIDLYVSTSSAGGGLQMIVAGAVGKMSAQSAERAALGAGAIVLDTFSFDDGRELHNRVQRIRHLRPDIALLAGGTEGGNVELPLELAELLLQADPRPRFGNTLRMPVIFAANSAAVSDAQKILAERFQFVPVNNLRPSLEREDLTAARSAIHDLFLHHVMSHAPGYDKLLGWSPVPIIPTPAAFGTMVETAARNLNKSILAVDIGGATTDVFSAIRSEEVSSDWIFNRSVSANLGMSYSVANVLVEAGAAAIEKWLPFTLAPGELNDRLRNKMVRPSSIPFTKEDLLIEQAICREALRMSLDQHRRLAVGLSGKKKKRTIGDIFRREDDGLLKMKNVDLIIGSGGVLSHAPSRGAAALMMLDAYQPTGFTDLAVDSIFMMPHLGTFSQVHEEAAVQILMRDCLIPLGCAIAPEGDCREHKPCLKIEGINSTPVTVAWGELKVISLATGEKRSIKVIPLQHSIDLGAGLGMTVEREVRGGVVGLIIDCRGRPIPLHSKDRNKDLARLNLWLETMTAESST